MQTTRVLSVACLVAGIAIYLGAVSGALFDQATPPLDVGATSTLVVLVLFGALGFLLDRRAGAAA